MVKLSVEEVRHVAKLANLKLKKSEIRKFQNQLSEIISYIQKLKSLKTEGVEPTSQVTGLENIFREDEVRPSLSQKEALSNAQQTYRGYFKIKAIF